MQGKCRAESSLYKYVAISNNIPLKTSEDDWKTRSYNHTKSLINLKYSNKKTLSAFLWDLRNKNIPAAELQWSTEKNVPAYSNINKRCLLCLYDKLAIITLKNEDNLLIKRFELMNKCRHENNLLLSNCESND